MKQYIDKDIITAEIERRYKIFLIGAHSAFRNGKCEALRETIDFLNTLEVQEVDLEKEATHYLLHEHLSPLNEVMHKADLKAEIQYHEDIGNAFKAGFKLGTALNRKED